MLTSINMDALQVLVTIGLLSSISVFVVAARKVSVLENLFLMNWSEVTISMSLIGLGFFTWFLAESMEDIFYTVYQTVLPITFILLIVGQILLVRVLWRRPR